MKKYEDGAISDMTTEEEESTVQAMADSALTLEERIAALESSAGGAMEANS